MRRFDVVTITEDDGEYIVIGHLSRGAGGHGRPSASGPFRLVASEIALSGGKELRLDEGSQIAFEGNRLGIKADQASERVELWV